MQREVLYTSRSFNVGNGTGVGAMVSGRFSHVCRPNGISFVGMLFCVRCARMIWVALAVQ
jgi:hypothetical protein